MKNLWVLGLGLVVALATGVSVRADEAAKKQCESGPKAGASLGAFNVTKVAGAEEDGIAEGRNLCYRCRNGSRPQVMVFTRATDEKVAELVAKLDKAIEEHEDSQLRVFVNVLADDQAEATEAAKKFAMTTKAKNIPFVVPNEFENGPADYGINPKAAVTVTMAVDGGVKGSIAAAQASELDVDSVLKSLEKILN